MLSIIIDNTKDRDKFIKNSLKNTDAFSFEYESFLYDTNNNSTGEESDLYLECIIADEIDPFFNLGLLRSVNEMIFFHLFTEFNEEVVLTVT